MIIWIISSICSSNKKNSNKNYRTHNKNKYDSEVINFKQKENEINYDESIDYIENNKTERLNRISEEGRLRENKEQIEQDKKSYICSAFQTYNVNCMWHLTHRDNVDKILERGILSHRESHQLGLNNIDISDPGAQRWRERSDNPHDRKIHEFAPFYINPKNPMLYVRRSLQDELCLLEVSLSALESNQYLITDGNAASRDTQFFDSVEKLNQLPWDVLRAQYWTNFADGRRKRCAEILVYPKVSARMINCIHCCSQETLNYVLGRDVDVQITHKYFF